MRKVVDGPSLTLRISLSEAVGARGEIVGRNVVVEMDGATMVERCDDHTVRAFAQEVKTLVKDWLDDL